MIPPGQVAEKAKVPPSEQKIVFAGRILSDDAQTLDSDKLQLNKEASREEIKSSMLTPSAWRVSATKRPSTFSRTVRAMLSFRF